MTENEDQNLEAAQNVVNDYGHLLAQLDGTCYAHPISRLPRTKEEIKNAIQLLLWELQGEDDTICGSLAQSYVYLAQFVEDDEAEIVSRGQAVLQSSDLDPDELDYADKAAPIINRIKLEMESLMSDIKAFIP
ncbi:MAG: hypothetical protein LJE73_03425 [Proteobacteria bacterium]|nr:hypothetical protein [Pseudomonadota bacterium]